MSRSVVQAVWQSSAERLLTLATRRARLRLTVDDSSGSTGHTATITNSAVTFAGLTTVNYTGKIASLQAVGGSGKNEFVVNSVAASTPVTVDGGTCSVYVGLFNTDPTTAGSGEGSVSWLAGKLNVTNSTPNETSLVIDSSGDDYEYFQVYSDHVTFTAGPTINFEPCFVESLPELRGGHLSLTCGINSLTVYGSMKGNNFQAVSVGPDTKVTIWGTASDVSSGAALGAVTRENYPSPKTLVPPVRTP